MTIIIRRDEGEEPAHHGGAWKVAYADFVTAMMAFFLLMWLLNATTEEQRTGLADYFAPTNLFGRSASGSGQPFGGKTANDSGSSVSTDGAPQTILGKKPPQQNAEEDDSPTPAEPLTAGAAQASESPDDGENLHPKPGNGESAATADQAGRGRLALVHGGDYAAARLTPAQNPLPQNPPGQLQPAANRAAAPQTEPTAADAAQDDADHEKSALQQAGAQVLEAIRSDPALRDAAGQLTIENVPEGLRIQVVDAEHRPMFALGSSTPTQRERALMQKVVPALAGLPNAISIAGHTDSLTYRGQDKDNWDLSAERANATRRILVDAGFPQDRIRSVTGNADRDLLAPGDPLSPVNRRITIIVLRHAEAARVAPTLDTPRVAPTASAGAVAR